MTRSTCFCKSKHFQTLPGVCVCVCERERERESEREMEREREKKSKEEETDFLKRKRRNIWMKFTCTCLGVCQIGRKNSIELWKDFVEKFFFVGFYCISLDLPAIYRQSPVKSPDIKTL